MYDLGAIIAHHRELDYLLAKGTDEDFISNWDGRHPFFKNQFSLKGLDMNDIQGYKYIRSDQLLKDKIANFHFNKDAQQYSIYQILPTCGSTTGILAFITWLKINQIIEVYYVPPLYFTFHYFFKIEGINLRPVSGSQLIDDTTTLSLPLKKSLLIVTDPIWYAGLSIKPCIIKKIHEWQVQTGSYVFVDGSFQYLSWQQPRLEESSTLDKELTFRMVCPTKALATHGFRFAYLLLPAKYYEEFDFLMDNTTGSSSIFDLNCSHIAMDILTGVESNLKLISYISDLYATLTQRELIETTISPDCGYFVFAKIKPKTELTFKSMDGKYFEQSQYKDYVRINLLSNAIQTLLNAD